MWPGGRHERPTDPKRRWRLPRDFGHVFGFAGIPLGLLLLRLHLWVLIEGLRVLELPLGSA
eukprot:scaffold69_cov248-Pinguiococcus_pyrenoidosus.AAC.88